MRILFVPYGTDKAPATRYRVRQYLPQLKKRGIDYRVFSSISAFSTGLMIRSPNFGFAAKFLYYAYVFTERFFRLLYVIAAARRYDWIFLQRTTFLFKLEKLLRKVNANIIFDIDDAIYLPDKEGTDIMTRIKKYIKMTEVVSALKVSKKVIVENEYIRDFVRLYCQDVTKIPGPIDTDRFRTDELRRRHGVVIGWIGSPATTPYLHMLDGVFSAIASKYDNVRFKFIGLGKYENPGIPFEKVEWSYDTEVGDLQSLDIGVMPMPDNEWTRGKLGCKMLQYMAVGIPAVVSYTPTNAEIVTDGVSGFFATGADKWIDVLSGLVEDERLRSTVGKRAREVIIDKCSLARNVDRLIEIFKKV